MLVVRRRSSSCCLTRPAPETFDTLFGDNRNYDDACQGVCPPQTEKWERWVQNSVCFAAACIALARAPATHSVSLSYTRSRKHSILQASSSLAGTVLTRTL